MSQKQMLTRTDAVTLIEAFSEGRKSLAVFARAMIDGCVTKEDAFYALVENLHDDKDSDKAIQACRMAMVRYCKEAKIPVKTLKVNNKEKIIEVSEAQARAAGAGRKAVAKPEKAEQAAGQASVPQPAKADNIPSPASSPFVSDWLAVNALKENPHEKIDIVCQGIDALLTGLADNPDDLFIAGSKILRVLESHGWTTEVLNFNVQAAKATKEPEIDAPAEAMAA